MSFEYLDDPMPFRVSPELRDRVALRGQTLRRRRRAGTVAVSVSMALLLIVGAGAAYGLRQAGKVQRVDTAESLTPVESLDQPYTVLLVGTDDLADRQQSANTDTMLLVRVDPIANRLGVVSIPRDLWVDIDGHSARINSAFALGGPESLIDTIEANLGVAVNHYIQVSMNGFRDLVDEVGGVDVNVAVPVRDQNSGLDLGVGCQTLDGAQALSLTRSRYFQIFGANGTWQSDPMSDVSRMARQRTLLLVALREVQAQSLDPFHVDGLVETLLANSQVDQTYSLGDLAATLRFVHGVPLDTIDQGMVPASGATRGGASVLVAPENAKEIVSSILEGREASNDDGGTKAHDPAVIPADPIDPTSPFDPAQLIRPCD